MDFLSRVLQEAPVDSAAPTHTIGTMPPVFSLRTASVEEALAVEAAIPEFGDPHTLAQYSERLAGRSHLILVAEATGSLVGFKVGYELAPSVFYSWLGGTRPDWRRQGVATALRRAQEAWAAEEGYQALQVKSKNEFPHMVAMLVTSGYRILEVVPPGSPDAKILFEKDLSRPDPLDH